LSSPGSSTTSAWSAPTHPASLQNKNPMLLDRANPTRTETDSVVDYKMVNG